MDEILRALSQAAGFVAVVVAVLALARDQRRKQLIEIQSQLYEAQKEATAQSESRRQEEREKCDAKINELNGRVSVLESRWGKSLGRDVAREVIPHIQAFLEKGDHNERD